MKRYFMATALLVAALLASGCDWWFGEEEKDVTIPENVSFYTGCPLSFYFVDENGNTLVNIDDTKTYPIAFRGTASEAAIQQGRSSIQTYVNEGTTLYVYNDGSNSLYWIAADQQYRFQCFFWGLTPEENFSFPIYFGNGDEYDVVTVTYRYVTTADNVQIQGASWAVDVVSVKYNGVEVLVGNENGKVYVVKPSQGATAVKIGSL